ncbi:hypothetical protein [Sphingomonas jeddahensis]|uniref:Uncharacterized protein n=1 Tax=Sphingomonas jeddahensis TaxID=1915074 RepID=A0A1V2EWP3_9SPHN|nr:hypothetical protein [Sphingomonas jeddahensis]ONF97020.1 hypothetical protein SPHI_04550 [Sphingomonas jeddahensis]
MNQTADQLLDWLAKELPQLRERLARTHAAIEETRRKLAGN